MDKLHNLVTFPPLRFFVTPQPPKPSMLSLVDGSWQVVPKNKPTIGQPLRFWLQPNAEDQARGLKPGLGATTMAINGAIGLDLTLSSYFLPF